MFTLLSGRLYSPRPVTNTQPPGRAIYISATIGFCFLKKYCSTSSGAARLPRWVSRGYPTPDVLSEHLPTLSGDPFRPSAPIYRIEFSVGLGARTAAHPERRSTPLVSRRVGVHHARQRTCGQQG